MRKKIGWILILLFGLFFAGYMITFFVFLTEKGLGLWVRIAMLLLMLSLPVGLVCLCKLLDKLGAKLRAKIKEKAQNENIHTENTVRLVSAKESKSGGSNQDSLPKKLKQKSDAVKKQEIAAEQAARAEMKKNYQDFINGEGRLPEGFSEKYNRTIQSGYILRETPFKEYLDEIWITVDALNNRTGISDWIYFDGYIEINAAIEMILDWVRRHREMNTYLYEKGFWIMNLYCKRKIMVVMENGDAFRNVTEKSIASCKTEQISFCIILSECELYDLIEHKAKTIKYTKYPNYHDETYADWWLGDSPAKQVEPQQLNLLEKCKESKVVKKSVHKNISHEQKIQQKK